MKKIICLMLVSVFILTAFSGCGKTASTMSENEDKQVTLKIALPWSSQQNTADVVEAINKKLETLLPNTKIELLLDTAFSQKWSLWMATKKPIDLAHTGFETDLPSQIEQENYLELNELVDSYAPNIAKLKEKYWYCYDNSSIDNKLYAIPNVQTYCNDTIQISFYDNAEYSKKIADEAWTSDKTTRKLWELYTEGLEALEKTGNSLSGKVNTMMLYEVAKRGYNFVGGGTSNICYDNSDSGKIINFHNTEEFKTYCEFAKIWAKKGWVSKDILTNNSTDGFGAVKGFRYDMDETTRRAALLSTNSNIYRICLDNPDNDVVSSDVGQNASYYAIPFTSENPVRAIKFLDLINSDEGAEILNLLAYGIEGKQYEFVDKENGDIKAFEYELQGSASTSYGIPNWMCGNMFLLYNIVPYNHGVKEYSENYYVNHLADVKKHVLYNLYFKNDAVSDKLSSIIKNNSEYEPSIYCGIIEDTDSLLSELETKNAAAGFNEIVKSYQKQADDYISSNK